MNLDELEIGRDVWYAWRDMIEPERVLVHDTSSGLVASKFGDSYRYYWANDLHPSEKLAWIAIKAQLEAEMKPIQERIKVVEGKIG